MNHYTNIVLILENYYLEEIESENNKITQDNNLEELDDDEEAI